jgi:hypothetical protein
MWIMSPNSSTASKESLLVFQRQRGCIFSTGNQDIKGHEHWLPASEHQVVEYWSAIVIQGNKPAVERIALG